MGSINTPAKKMKLELGQQLPIKSNFKFSRGVMKHCIQNRLSLSNHEDSTKFWNNKSTGIVNKYQDGGPIEFSLPNSMIVFFL